MTDILIVGAGFAGLAAADALSRPARTQAGKRVRLFDAHAYTTMVPALPDLAGGRYEARYLTENIERLVGRGVTFHQERVRSLDFRGKKIVTDGGERPYDYLIVTAGSVTNFFGFDQNLDSLYTLDVLEQGTRIRDDFACYLKRAESPQAIVVGGGYTGLELACNLQFAGRSFRPQPRVTVVELKDSIVPFMPGWVRDYMQRQTARRAIEVITGTSVKTFDGKDVELSNGRAFQDVFLCWTTGTKFAIQDIDGEHEQIKDGRFVVDDYLRIPQHPEVFAAGDSAAMQHGGEVLRKAVNFSLYSGRCAGRNAARAAQGAPLEAFRPVDPGWVIPFCDVGVGILFGKLRVRGRLPLALHYFMSGARNYNAENRLFFWKRAWKALTR